VLAAGAFSHRIAATLGEKIPLETERGYNTTLPPDALDLRCQITFGGHGFVVSRLSTGIRVGGAVELGGLSLPPNYKRSEAMLTEGKGFSARPQDRRRHAMDGLPPLAARQPACDWPLKGLAPM
jgi:D-amino-acid dehydrogenase